MASILNEAALSKLLLKDLNEAMLKAAEPILQKALKDIERQMRERMTAMLISYLEENLTIDRLGHDIRIMIKQAKP